MDRAAKFCLVSFVLLALMTSQAGGTNTQGLYWGPKSGDRLDYVYEIHANLTYSVFSLNERLHVIVNVLPTLPDIVTNLEQATCYNVTAYWANGSLIPYSSMMFGAPAMMFFAVGNWPLITDLVSVGLTTYYEIVDEPSVWGIRAGMVS